jgi:hypothetical protein
LYALAANPKPHPRRQNIRLHSLKQLIAVLRWQQRATADFFALHKIEGLELLHHFGQGICEATPVVGFGFVGGAGNMFDAYGGEGRYEALGMVVDVGYEGVYADRDRDTGFK